MKESILITQWFEEARRGNRTCLNNLITFYHAQLLSYAMKICKFSNIAEDALQEAYINALVHFNEVKEPENFFFWLRTIVKRSCWQQMNLTNRTVPLSVKLIDSKISDNKIEDEIEKNNTNEFLWERMSRLSEPLRIVLLLRYFSNFNNYYSISEILDIPIGTVRSRLNEAKKQLKKSWNLSLSEMPQNIKSEAEYWNEFYEYSFKFIQRDPTVKQNFNNHLLPDLTINFTSGKTKQGRELIEKEFEDDLRYGTSYKMGSIFNLKNIGILQGENINSFEYSDRCPPTSTLIFHRKNDKTFYLLFHNPSSGLQNSAVESF
jgi:RNA polymerase sigma factor (sigma-70 family)